MYPGSCAPDICRYPRAHAPDLMIIRTMDANVGTNSEKTVESVSKKEEGEVKMDLSIVVTATSAAPKK